MSAYSSIILFNGAPRSGKDTAVSFCRAYDPSGFRPEKFALPLKIGVPLAYGIPLSLWEQQIDTAENKDQPSPLFFGKTPREVQIALSENFFKPLHGPDVFGKLLCSRLDLLASPWLAWSIGVSDSGFREEAIPVVEHFGASRVFLIHIQREGYTYANDSRSRIDLSDLGVRQLSIENNGDLEKFHKRVIQAYQIINAPRDGQLYDEGSDKPRPETEDEWQERIGNMLAAFQHEMDVEG